ncbi:MAG: alanine--glyoxylate aminotransferase family protein [Ardenticatenales bacterium]|nr:alanine--glyoxylate aminotransferase family protein [Ardenticatenales bacterium]
MASPRAIEVWQQRREPVRSLYCDWSEWLPVMRAYEEGRPAYFATPPVNLINALSVSLQHILAAGMEHVWSRHEQVADAFRAAWQAMGLQMLPARPEVAANTLSALYYPEGVDGSVLGHIRTEGVVLAGGLHPDIRTRYFRVGHMGATRANDVLATVGAIERGLQQAGAALEPGAGLAAAQQQLLPGALHNSKVGERI